MPTGYDPKQKWLNEINQRHIGAGVNTPASSFSRLPVQPSTARAFSTSLPSDPRPNVPSPPETSFASLPIRQTDPYGLNEEEEEQKRWQISPDWFLSPFYGKRDLEDYSPFQQTLMYSVAEFIEGIAFGADLVYGEDDLMKASKGVGAVTGFLGELTRMSGEMLLAGGIVTLGSRAVTSLSWASKAFRYGKTIQATQKYAPRLLHGMATGAARGAVFSAIEQILAPEERKPGLYGTAMNTIMFGAGDLGQQLARDFIVKKLPKANNKLLGELMTSIADSAFSFAAALPFVDDKEGFTRELGAEIVMIGVMDTVMWGFTHNRFAKSKALNRAVKTAEAAYDEWQRTGSAAAEITFLESINAGLNVGIPETDDRVSKLTKLLDDFAEYRVDEIKQKAKTMSSEAKPAETAKTILTEADDGNQYIDSLAKTLLERPSKITGERLDHLRTTNTTKEGAPLNTTRYITSGETLDVLDTIARLQERFPVERQADVLAKAKKSLSEVEDLAEGLGRTLEEAAFLLEATKDAPEILTKLRAITVANAAELRAQAKKILGGVDSDVEFARFLYLVDIQNQLTGTLRGINNNFGRTLAAGNILVGDDLVNLSQLMPEDLIDNPDARLKIEAAIDTAGGKKRILQQAEAILKADSMKDINKKAKEILNKKPIIKALVEGRNASLLTSPWTAMTNFVSQAINQVLERITEGVSVGVGKVIQLFKGDYAGRMTASEFTYRVMGDVEGMISSVTKPIVSRKDLDGIDFKIKGDSLLETVTNLLKYPQKVEELIQRTGLQQTRMNVEGFHKPALSTEQLKDTKVGKAIDKTASVLSQLLGKTVKLDVDQATMRDLISDFLDAGFALQRLASFGMLELGDRPYASGGYYADLNGTLRRLGEARGLKGRQLKNFIAETKEQALMLRKFKQLSAYDPKLELPEQLKKLSKQDFKLIDSLDVKAMKHGDYLTWKDEFKDGLVKDIDKLLQRNPVLKFIVPFYHTPMKILAKTSQYTPGLNLFSKAVREDLSGVNGARARDMALSRMIVGGTLYVIGWSLSAAGLITPTAKTPAQRRAMQEAGIPEHAIKVGDTWIDINKLDPAPSAFFGLMSDFVNILSDPDLTNDDASKVATAILLSITKNTLDKTYMKSLSDTLDAIYGIGSGSYISRFVDTLIPFYGARKAVPSIKAFGLNPWYEENFKEARSLIEAVTNTGLDSLDSYGKPSPNRTRFLGLDWRKGTDSPIRKELLALGASLPKMPDTLYGVKLTPEQHWELRRMLDTEGRLEDKLNKLVTSRAWDRYTTEKKKQLIDETYRKTRDRVRRQFLRKYPEIQQKVRQEAKRKRARLFDPDVGTKPTPPWASRV